MSKPDWILVKSPEEVYHLFSHGWGSREGSGLVTRCNINDTSFEIVGVKPLPPTATRCVKCFGHAS